MKKAIALLLAAVTLLLAGCSQYHPAKPVGEVPGELLPLIESRLLRKYGAIATANGILDVIPTDADGDDRTDFTEFVKYDKYGVELARGQYPQDNVHEHRLEAVTSDDGFLLVNGYSYYLDSIAGEDDPKLEDVSSDIVKFDRLCNVEWTLTVPGCDWFSLFRCFETEDGYVFFGTRDTGKAEGAGKFNPSEIYILQVSFEGEERKTVTFSGSAHDHLYCAVPQDDGFALYLSSESDDGDFAHEGKEGDPASTYWIFRLDDELQCVSKERIVYDPRDRDGHAYYIDSFFLYRNVGYLDGKAVYSDDSRFADPNDQRMPVYDGGEVHAVLDYGAFYLVVSHNLTGDGERPGGHTESWWTTETVYTAFDKDGDLLWRTAVDNPYVF